MTQAKEIKTLIGAIKERIELENQCQNWDNPDMDYSNICLGKREALYQVLWELYEIDVEDIYEAYWKNEVGYKYSKK